MSLAKEQFLELADRLDRQVRILMEELLPRLVEDSASNTFSRQYYEEREQWHQERRRLQEEKALLVEQKTALFNTLVDLQRESYRTEPLACFVCGQDGTQHEIPGVKTAWAIWNSATGIALCYPCHAKVDSPHAQATQTTDSAPAGGESSGAGASDAESSA